MKARRFLFILLVVVLAAGCSSQATRIPDSELISAPGFRYSTPKDWTELPAGQGQCEENEHCLMGSDGALMAVQMSALEVGCPGSSSLAECLDQVEKQYKNNKRGYNLIGREDFTTGFGLTGETLEYTYSESNANYHVEEFWTHNGSLKIRVRYTASPVVFDTLDELIPLTFLSVRPNRPPATPTSAGAGAETPAATPAP